MTKKNNQSNGFNYYHNAQSQDFAMDDWTMQESKNDSNFSVDANGNYNVDNAMIRLNTYCMKNNIRLEMVHDTKEVKEGDKITKRMAASFSVEAKCETSLTKTVSASALGTSKKDATKKCALDIVLQLYKLKAIEAITPDPTGTLETGYWTKESSIARLKEFCINRSIEDDFETLNLSDGTFTSSFSFKSEVDSELKAISATCQAKNRKLSTQLCALRILSQLYKASLIEAKGQPRIQLGKRPAQKQISPGNGAPQKKLPKNQASSQEKLILSPNFSIGSNGNYNLDNAVNKLNEYCMKNDIRFEMIYDTKDVKEKGKKGKITKRMTASFSVEVTNESGLTKTVSGFAESISKKDATKKCALDIVLQLYKLNAVAYITPDPTGTLETGYWTKETSIARLKQFCSDGSINDDFVTSEQQPDGTFTTSFSFKSAKNGELRAISATSQAKNRKLSTQMCALNILSQLYKASLVEAKGTPCNLSEDQEMEETTMQKYPNAYLQVQNFCLANNTKYEISYETDLGLDKKWKFTASTSMNVTLKNGRKKIIRGSYVDNKKKLAERGCLGKIVEQLSDLGLLNAEPSCKIKFADATTEGDPLSLINSRSVLQQVCAAFELDHHIDYTDTSPTEHTAIASVTLIIKGKERMCKTTATAQTRKMAAKIASLNMLNELAKLGLKWPDKYHSLDRSGKMEMGLQKNGYWSMHTAIIGIRKFCRTKGATCKVDVSKEEKKMPFSRPVYTAKVTIDIKPQEESNTTMEYDITGTFRSPGKTRATSGAYLDAISQLYKLSLIEEFKDPKEFKESKAS